MGIFSASSRSSQNLLKILLPGGRKIAEQNNLIKRVTLGISSISKNIKDSSIVPDKVKKTVVHVAFFIQDQDGFSNTGIILDYGFYEYIDSDKLIFEYKEEGGLRYGYINYLVFMKDSGKAAMVNLDITKSPKVRFNYLIDKLKENGSWRQKDYQSLTHNCQDFAIEVIKILKPQFNEIGIMPGENASLIEGKTPEEIIPDCILKTLHSITNG